MAVTYTNRRGKTYYLHQGVTKKGNPKYYFALRSEGDLAEVIPSGYEIYENPNAQVFLRRIRPQVITDEEVKIVEKGLQQYCRIKNCLVDVKKNVISIHTPDQNVDRLAASLSFFPGTHEEKVQLVSREALTYSPMLQFVLVDKKQRLFETQRYCFLGAIDDWIMIGTVGELPELVKTYVPHLGEESYFELY